MRILLAVSGGIDSMYLANRAPELFPGASFAVAHCNFRLRGAESDSDEAFVRSWCTEHGMECFVTHFDTAEHAAQEGISIEMAARNLRYAWFSEVCRENGFNALATAHNANDNAETLMLNLLRGTGSKGLRGMSETGHSFGMTILRPLLQTSREEIENWMNDRGMEWHEDRTNAENEYKRNRIRNCVFPMFKEINPSFIQTLGADMQRFAQVDDIAEDYYREALGKGIYDAAEGSISVPGLLDLKHWRYVLWRLLEGCGFSQQTFEKLVELLQRYQAGPMGTVTLSGKTFQSPTHSLVAVGRKLRIVSNPTL